MKTITTRIYSYQELTPEARERAIQSLMERNGEDPDAVQFTLSEMVDSLKAVAEACSLRLADWSLGTYCRDPRAEVRGNIADLEGNKARAAFLRVLIGAGYARPKRFADMAFPGVCGFTGVCYDDTVAEAVWDALGWGETIAGGFRHAASALCDSAEKEYEWLCGREHALEYLDETEEQFLENGDLEF